MRSMIATKSPVRGRVSGRSRPSISFVKPPAASRAVLSRMMASFGQAWSCAATLLTSA